MLAASVRMFVALVYSGLLVTAVLQEARKTPNAQPSMDKLPFGTILVVQDAVHGRTYFATQNLIQEMRSNARFSLGGQHTSPESIVSSADGRFLILRTADDSFVLQAANLHLVRKLSNSYAWWEGAHLGYIDRYHGYILTGGQRFQTSQRRTDIFAADPTGKFFLGTHTINRGNIQNGNTPTHYIQLWKKARNGTLQVARDLTIVTYDLGSQRSPRRLAVLGGHIVVFGYPNGGPGDEDFIGVLRKGRVSAPLKDSRGRLLQFIHAPLVARNAIIGLAEAVSPPHGLTGDKYIYQITEQKIMLRAIAKSILFVTYNAKRNSIGYGVAGQDSVAVKFNSSSQSLFLK